MGRGSSKKDSRRHKIGWATECGCVVGGFKATVTYRCDHGDIIMEWHIPYIGKNNYSSVASIPHRISYIGGNQSGFLHENFITL